VEAETVGRQLDHPDPGHLLTDSIRSSSGRKEAVDGVHT
jgi:hypothetical protein